MDQAFPVRLRAVAEATEAALERLLSSATSSGEIARPERLLAAMRHAALGGGKRLRPFLLVECARLFDAADDSALDAAAALECVHCYSLVHDDLPAMDDDDLRRGKPTVHRAFDEATAILAGDALLTLAFDILARLDVDTDMRVALIGGLARAAGVGGMAGGQMLDIAAEGVTQSETAIVTLQAMKTGALIRYACEAGAILGRAGEADRGLLAAYGEAIGLAFQLADDLIDATAETASAGKKTAKDSERGKATLVAIHGIDGARARLGDAAERAVRMLAPLGRRADALREAARFIAARNS